MSESERRRQAYQRAQAALEQGMALGPCVLVTLTATRVRADGSVGRDYNVEPTLRSEVWHLLWTRLKRRWPEAQAFTVLEWGKRSGIHLHIVVRAAPGLDVEWLHAALAGAYPQIDLHQEEVYAGWGLAGYLTKTLYPGSDAVASSALGGRYTHPTSQSRGWLPAGAGASRDTAAGHCQQSGG